MGSDTPQYLPRIIAGPVICSISGTFAQTLINQVSPPPCPPSWWKPRHREARPLSQGHTAGGGSMNCFAPPPQERMGPPSLFHLELGGPLNLPGLGAPCLQFLAPALLQPGGLARWPLNHCRLIKEAGQHAGPCGPARDRSGGMSFNEAPVPQLSSAARS